MSVVVIRPLPADAVPVVALDAAALPGWLARQPAPVRNWVTAVGFTAAAATHCLIPDADGRLGRVLAGIGRRDDPFALAHLPLALPPGRYRIDRAGVAPDADAAMLGWRLGAYQFSRYKAAARAPAELCVPPSPAVAAALRLADACCLVRDLVNTPTQDLGPAELAAAVHAAGADFGAAVREWVGDELLAANFPAIHAVGRASHRPPRLVELEWGDPKHPVVAIVGKGVCFDTGGLDLKPPEFMRNMKKDMGGGAHAIALARLVMAARLPVRLRLLVPAVENAVAADAFRPGEVVMTRQGLSVEIGNTDAEGRVILADALTYAGEAKDGARPDLILDFATLTGAARVALGPDLPALFCNRDDLAAEFAAFGEATADPLWRLPLWPGYRSQIETPVADLSNTGKGPQAGAITAALFLERFVPAGTPWCHVDLFAWNDTARPGRPAGGEAQTLRAAFALLQKRYGRPGGLA